MKPIAPVRRLAICIATYRRPVLLARLLESLPEQSPAGLHVELRVVDNDAEGSALPVVLRHRRKNTMIVHYAREPEQNIALARNRALAMGPADLLAFIDDDEVAQAGWLEALVQALDQTGSDAVVGPVIGRLPHDAPRWAQHGWYDKRVPARNGPLTWTGTRTSNTLVRGQWFYQEGMRFDPSFGRSGGSDTALFAAMAARGGTFSAASDATVHEDVEFNRLSRPWLYRRHYRGGMVLHRIAAQHGETRPIRWTLARLTRLIRALVQSGLSRPARRPPRWTMVFMNTGLLLGGLCAWLHPQAGARFVEYHPRPLGLKAEQAA